MIFGTVSASERTAPVQGEQPSDRMRHMTICGCSPGSSGTNGCSSDDQRVAADDDLALLGEVERHDGNASRRGCSSRRRSRSSSTAGTRGCSRPGGCGRSAGSTARAAGSSDPTGRWRRAARRCAPWRASAPRRAARRRTPRRSRRPRSASSSDFVLSAPQQRCVPTRNGCVPSAIASSLVWTISRAPISRGVPVAELDHLAELVGRVDVQQRERNRARDRTPSAPAAAGPTSPCRSSRASPAARTRRPPRA